MDANHFEKFTKEAKEALIIAQEKSQTANLSYVGTEHILLGILYQENSLGSTILNNFGVSSSNVELVLKTVGRASSSKQATKAKEPGTLSGYAKQVIENALSIASKFNHNFIGTEHLLYAIVSQDNTAATVILENMKINPKHIKSQILEIFQKSKEAKVENPNGNASNNPLEFFLNGLNGVLQNQNDTQSFKKGKKSKSKTPTLDFFGVNLTEMAKNNKIDPVIGRAEEVQRLVSILNRKTKNNPVLIGEPGVGKTAVVEGLALRIAEKKVPHTMLDKTILSIPLGNVVAGTKFRGEFEDRIRLIVEEASANKNIIIFIDELHTIIGAGSAEGSLDAANILKPALSRAQIQLIGATTTNEYRKAIESDSALERRFQTIFVDEPSIEEALEIITGLRTTFEDHHNLMITDEALSAATKLSDRYISERFLPDKAIDILDEACALKKVTSLDNKSELDDLKSKLDKISKKKETAVSKQDFEKAASFRDEEMKLLDQIEQLKITKTPRHLRKRITEEDVASIIHKMTGVPVNKLISTDLDKLKSLESILHKSIIGQNNAVTEVSKAIRRARLGISSPTRPIGSFLFLGPTGVGKTELVKTLAKEIFHDPKALIKIDMSEFMERHSTSRLVGTSAGYVGYEDGGQLTEAVRRKPYSVVLFDEIEKAHPDFFNLLLQIMEDGCLTDAKGKKVDFTNTIIILTSNIGAAKLTEEASMMGFNISQSQLAAEQKEFDEAREMVLEDVKKSFKPEFINRLDNIIVFEPLTHKEVKDIVKLLISDLNNLLSEKQITVSLSTKALEKLADLSYDKQYGARPARRMLQQHIQDKITDLIIDKSISSACTVKVGLKNDEFTFAVK
jgi:ATP-dependent Clp protease ATP-binding subunit ClpC